VVAVLQAAAQTPKSRGELQKAAGIKDQKHFRKAYLEPLLAAGWVEMTIPDKPRSSKQKYRTTEVGFKALQERESKHVS
jgi:ATP-dependent DNA helicase RecG